MSEYGWEENKAGQSSSASEVIFFCTAGRSVHEHLALVRLNSTIHSTLLTLARLFMAKTLYRFSKITTMNLRGDHQGKSALC